MTVAKLYNDPSIKYDKSNDIIYHLKSWKKKSKLSPSKRIKEIRKIKAETN